LNRISGVDLTFPPAAAKTTGEPGNTWKSILFTDDTGEHVDLQHAVVDSRVPSRGKLGIWLMGYSEGALRELRQ